MNCFNLTELQSLFQTKFFKNLLTYSDNREFLSNTLIGLRFKLNNLNVIDNNQFLFNQYGLNTFSSSLTFETSSNYLFKSSSLKSFFSQYPFSISNLVFFFNIENFFLSTFLI